MRLNLDDLGLRGGQRRVSTYMIEVLPLTIGGVGFDVVVPDGVGVTVERIAGGYLVDVELMATVCGPCSRCLEEVCVRLHAEQQEFVPTGAEGWPESEAEASPFIEGTMVDLAGLGREAVVLAMPDRVLCSQECKGLCPNCGADLNKGDCSCQTLEV